MKSFSKIPLSLSLFFMIAIVSSCKKEEPTPTPTKGDVKVEVNYVFGSSALPWDVNQTMVHPATGDTLTFTEFAFYLSNVKLKKEDGTWWSEPESYHLICAKCTEKNMFIMKDVPAGIYTEMAYTLGVDSLRNVSGAQTGDLSPTKGMFWDWNTGYIMIKAEGSSPQSPTGTFTFHLGGFSGPNNIVTPKTITFGSAVVNVAEPAIPTIVLQANPARLWHTSPSVSVTSAIHMPGPEAKIMADDFFGNISFTEIK
ncbi:MAG: hypothetical protein K1X61_02025 [Chitinophagales bacterium]|nr:hypothetical protein [Chitinophagales bacterium]